MKRAWILAALFAVGCKNGPSQDECKQLLEHLTDLEFKQAGAAANSDAMKAEIAKQKTAVAEAKATEFIDTCTKKMARSRVACAITATALDGESSVAKCDDAN